MQLDLNSVLKQYSLSIFTEHTMATPLEDVGKQVCILLCIVLLFVDCASEFLWFNCYSSPKVWRAAFLLADYILFKRDMFRSCTVLELGGGTGIASIIMGMIASRVYCTGKAVIFNEISQTSTFILGFFHHLLFF